MSLTLIILSAILLAAAALALMVTYGILRSCFSMSRHIALVSTVGCSMLAISILRVGLLG
jgi:hypothetical protein